MRRWLAVLIVTTATTACAKQEEPTTGLDDSCVKEKTGRVQLIVEAEPIEQSRVTAKFAANTISSRAPKCTVRQIAGCTVTECVRAEPAGTQCRAAEVITTAGPIGVSGGDKPALTMNADGKRSYAGFSSAGVRWAPGTEVTVAAEGAGEGADGVAAFEAKLTFPSRVQITGPADYVSKKNPIALDWKNGVPLTWTPGVGTVYLHLTQGDPELRKQTDIECEAESSAGAFTLPPDTLAQLEGTRDTKTANAKLEVAGRARVELTSSGYRVLVEALHKEEERYLVLSLEGATPK